MAQQPPTASWVGFLDQKKSPRYRGSHGSQGCPGQVKLGTDQWIGWWLVVFSHPSEKYYIVKLEIGVKIKNI